MHSDSADGPAAADGRGCRGGDSSLVPGGTSGRSSTCGSGCCSPCRPAAPSPAPDSSAADIDREGKPPSPPRTDPPAGVPDAVGVSGPSSSVLGVENSSDGSREWLNRRSSGGLNSHCSPAAASGTVAPRPEDDWPPSGEGGAWLPRAVSLSCFRSGRKSWAASEVLLLLSRYLEYSAQPEARGHGSCRWAGLAQTGRYPRVTHTGMEGAPPASQLMETQP